MGRSGSEGSAPTACRLPSRSSILQEKLSSEIVLPFGHRPSTCIGLQRTSLRGWQRGSLSPPWPRSRPAAFAAPFQPPLRQQPSGRMRRTGRCPVRSSALAGRGPSRGSPRIPAASCTRTRRTARRAARSGRRMCRYALSRRLGCLQRGAWQLSHTCFWRYISCSFEDSMAML